MHCVIGSGPAGVACASALLRRGATVQLLDGGISLEPSRAELVARMSQTRPEDWTNAQLAQFKTGMEATRRGLPTKLVYGSDFAYRDEERDVRTDYDGVGLRPSLAVGGLSNVWGAAMMPCRPEDTADWPVNAAQLAEHYRAVLGFIGHSARPDDLSGMFPLYTDQPSALDLSTQSRVVLQVMNRNRERLNASGIHFGQARVAVRTRAPGSDTGCVYCGLCMYGCPYGYIYNSADTLQELRAQERFTYISDLVVTSLEESAGAVRIRGCHRVTRQPFEREASRVFLAAGVIPTAQILLRSMNAYDRQISIKDSQYFLLPMALTRRVRNVRHEALYGLSQLFIEIMDEKISGHTVHLQLYSYSELIGRVIAGALGPLAKPLDFLARELEGRLMLAQGFLHSNESPCIFARLSKSGRTSEDRFELRAEANPGTNRTIRRVVRALMKNARRIGALPLPMLSQIAEPGRSFHSGGTFPMRTHPGAFESDTLGRPNGWKRVHAVDATVLPSVPATTITLPVMANAHRIGWESSSLD